MYVLILSIFMCNVYVRLHMVAIGSLVPRPGPIFTCSMESWEQG